MMDEITIYKCNHLGEVIFQYPGAVLRRRENWVCVTAIFNLPESDLGFVTFRQGDVFVEWFYADRWYNVFRVEDGQSARLKGWYCNITRPAYITDDAIYADDLALDIFVMPNGNLALLDEEEFDSLNLSTDERMAALRAVQTIRQAAAQREAPFHEILSNTERLR